MNTYNNFESLHKFSNSIKVYVGDDSVFKPELRLLKYC